MLWSFKPYLVKHPYTSMTEPETPWLPWEPALNTKIHTQIHAHTQTHTKPGRKLLIVIQYKKATARSDRISVWSFFSSDLFFCHHPDSHMLSFKLINKKRVCVEAEILLITVIITCIIWAESCIWSSAIFSTVSGWFCVSECACLCMRGFWFVCMEVSLWEWER